MHGENLFYIGVAVMAGAAVLAIIAIIVLCISKKRLNEHLDVEFGERRQ